MRFRNMVASALVGSVLLFAGTAMQALTLADLVAGAEVTSGNGNLTFNNFTAGTRGKGMHKRLAKYEVIVLDDGIEVSGHGKAGKRGALRFAYDVVAAAITGVGLEVTAAGSGRVNGAKSFFDGGALVGELDVSAHRGSDSDTMTFTAFEKLSVEETIRKSKGVRRFSVANTFESSSTSSGSSVPEPGTLLLLGSGIAGLAVLGRRRR